MLDYESQIYSKVAAALRKQFPTVFVTGEYVKSPPRFPAVFITESDNALYRRGSSSSNDEEFSAVTYEVDVFSNRKTGKKSEAKAIMVAVSEQLHRLNFQRMMMSPIPNEADSTIYRYHAKFRAVIGNGTLYRR